VLREPIAVRLKGLIRRVAGETQSDVGEPEVLPDHVRLLCRVDPRFGIARFVRLVKGRSSRLLRQEFPELRRRLPTLWTNAWFVSAVGGTPLAAIERYVADQKGR
jgi:putative transposase